MYECTLAMLCAVEQIFNHLNIAFRQTILQAFAYLFNNTYFPAYYYPKDYKDPSNQKKNSLSNMNVLFDRLNIKELFQLL